MREYWVIHAPTRAITIHRDPGPNGYVVITENGANEVLTPTLAPGLAVKLADLG